MQGQRAEIDWKDGTPVATRFDDPYFSLSNGPAETTHVFLQGNDLPARFNSGFHIAELGFGTGLNCIMAWDAFRKSGLPGALRFTSFEAFPMANPDMTRALAAAGTPPDLTDRLLSALAETPDRADLPGLTLRVILGDARETLPAWTGCADAWFLDGFSPAKNPELWGPALLREVARHTAPRGTVATYSAAGHIRRGLRDSGFDVTRAAGFGRKRHMSRGILR
ncbi:tRNA (5-methylaminomethyl-2-thiouridine)(34)-methyltransferase MnmD [Roseisalinus antarcticus]|uniref:tRNA 5-methylaminomethyl-2-thiouridine biosynthesis bifunctional protein MnmC n=1 Tax=Roseisalinus antarcticus TaxID=254357 RepID=A0A1Y5SQ68_9RHOB|nr:tRNA (5-methylaminomethyl-2-thiouridine)(34)-methyltransferase MnmD [Roseisalinus antarcticus]SLN44136.1 tRNA 5-methylaminomethyl-2-thiouridine biosynthesis bifunctional protein MnmC [Roseisalinus antarcticus]